jgi:dihydropteroate synthase
MLLGDRQERGAADRAGPNRRDVPEHRAVRRQLTNLRRVDGPYPTIRIGNRRFDVRTRALVMGILNRTPDSFYDRGATWNFDAFVRRADELVRDGADLLDVGGVKAGPGPDVSEAEELDRVVPAVEAIRTRFDLPVSVDTWRASVLDAACDAGAVVGNDISGFADPNYLDVAAAHDATVVATHIRLRPRVADPAPHYDDLVGEVTTFLLERAKRAEAAGLDSDQIVLDAGLDLGKTPAQSAVLLRESAVHADLGYPLLLSASNKRFIGELLDHDVSDRREESLAAVAYGVICGARIVRVHDVAASRRVCATLDALLAARAEVAALTSGGAVVRS